MKQLLGLLLLVALAACQSRLTTSSKTSPALYVPSNVREANRLALGQEDVAFKQNYLSRNVRTRRYRRQHGWAVPGWYRKGFGSVLLPLPNGKTATPDSTYVNSCYMDAMRVCNLHYRMFLDWNATIHSTQPYIYHSLLPDTTVWLQHFPDEAIGTVLKNRYFRDPAFDYHPVVGVSWEQAQAYALWRTDRINEALLIYRGYIQANFAGQQGVNNFNTLDYLRRYYEALPGATPMIDVQTGQERSVSMEDGVLLPFLRLPTAEELAFAAKHRADYHDDKALRVLHQKIQDQRANYPIPAFYDHNQYQLPNAILTAEETTAPYQLNDGTVEWTQQGYDTHEAYQLSHYHGKDADGRWFIAIPTYVLHAEGKTDSVVMQQFAQQHQGGEGFRVFRCVMPNVW